MRGPDMAEAPSGDLQEAELDRHYAKVLHVGQKGRLSWKCLLAGCPRPRTWSLKKYIVDHWRKEHPGCNLTITEHLRPGPKTSETSRKAPREELIANCAKHFGFFPERWLRAKQDKLNFFRKEV